MQSLKLQGVSCSLIIHAAANMQLRQRNENHCLILIRCVHDSPP